MHTSTTSTEPTSLSHATLPLRVEAPHIASTVAPYGGARPVTLYETRSTLRDVDDAFFAPIMEGVAHEGTMLHPSLRDIAASFAHGEAVVARDVEHGGRPIGYVRLEPLLSERVRHHLALPSLFPNLFEAGTMFVSSEGRYRGQGHLSRMCAALLAEYRAPIERGEMLILGTTKDVRVLRALDDGDLLTFAPVHHLTFPHLAAFTCICDGSMGRGYQFGVGECPSRLEGALQGVDLTVESLPRTGASIPCTMFVNSLEVAAAAERILAQHFGGASNESVEGLRAALMALGHYPSHSRQTAEPRVEMTVENRPLWTP